MIETIETGHLRRNEFDNLEKFTFQMNNWEMTTFSRESRLQKVTSVTRWLDSQQQKFAQWHKTFAKVGSKLYQILNKPSKNCTWLSKFHQSGRISPNLVTLVTLSEGKFKQLLCVMFAVSRLSSFNLKSCHRKMKHF